MSEHLSTNDNTARLEKINRQFFLTWAEMHAAEIAETTVLEEHPSQSINCFKSESLLPSADMNLEDIMERIAMIFEFSLEEKSKAREFLDALNQPYPFSEEGYTYIDYIVAKYISQGKNIAATMIHADDGLTDVPRLTAIVKHTLGTNFGDQYLNQVGEIASPSLKFEKYMGFNVPDLTCLVGETVWMPPAWTENVKVVRENSGLTEAELIELYTYITKGAGTVLLADLKISKKGLGRVTVISPPASRAELKTNPSGEVISLSPRPVNQASANLIQRYDAIWPVTIYDETLILGPIIDLPPAKHRGDRDMQSMKNVEDGVEINVEQLNSIIGRPGIANYSRSTPQGELYSVYTQRAELASALGKNALGFAT